MTTADVPAEIGWVHVTLPRLVAIVADGPTDPDAHPDGVPVQGTVTFTPNLTAGTVVVTSTGVGVLPQAKRFDLIDGALDVYLIHPGDPDLNPAGWTYAVTVTVTGGPGVGATTIRGTLDVPAGVTEVDLLPLLPLSAATGGTVTLTPGPEGPAGPPGEGVRAGGDTGQTLVKVGPEDFNTGWVDPGAASVPDATTTAKGKLQLAGDLAGTADAPTVPGLAGKAAAEHTHPAGDVSDSTTVGRAVLTAADAATARGAIGAGTSSLVLGTTAGTAKAGDYAPGWTEVTGKPATFPPSAHTHAPDDLGSGTPAAGQYLDGDGTWKELPEGGGSPSVQVTPVVRRSSSGWWIGCAVPGSSTNNQNPGTGSLHFMPVIVSRQVVVDRIGAHHNGLGTGTVVGNLALYSSTADSLPGVVLRETGPFTPTTQWVGTVADFTLEPGVLYYIAAVWTTTDTMPNLPSVIAAPNFAGQPVNLNSGHTSHGLFLMSGVSPSSLPSNPSEAVLGDLQRYPKVLLGEKAS